MYYSRENRADCPWTHSPALADQEMERKIQMRITKDTLIGDILKMDMGMARILMQNGMGCVGCRLLPGRAWARPAPCMA